MGLNTVRVRAMPNVVVAAGATLCVCHRLVCVCVCDCKNPVSVAPVAVFREEIEASATCVS